MKEYRCFGCHREDGWRIDVVLFEQQMFGELRAYCNDALRWTHPIGMEEIAMFAAKRIDLLEPYVDKLMAEHAHDVLG